MHGREGGAETGAGLVRGEGWGWKGAGLVNGVEQARDRGRNVFLS